MNFIGLRPCCPEQMCPQSVASDNFIPAYIFYKTGISIALKKNLIIQSFSSRVMHLIKKISLALSNIKTLTQVRRLLSIQITGIVPVSSILRRTFKKHSFY
jgi:hypothetical protein